MPAPSPVHGIAAGRAAVREVGEDLERLLDDRRGVALPIERGDEAEPAGVVLERRVVESLLGRECHPVTSISLVTRRGKSDFRVRLHAIFAAMAVT